MPPGSTEREDRLARTILVVAMALSAATLLVGGRHLTFWSDELTWLVFTDDFTPAHLLTPHNSHLIATIAPKVCERIARTSKSTAPASPASVRRSTAANAPRPSAIESWKGIPSGETATSCADPKNSRTTAGTSAIAAPRRRRTRWKSRTAFACRQTIPMIRNGR